MTIALETKDLTKIYKSSGLTVKAVDNVSMQIHLGEFVALVGPSGSGKTTMLAILAGLLKPTSGQVLIDGHDLSQMNDGQLTAFRRQNIGFTFQSNNAVPFLTALENVELMLRLNGKLNKETHQEAKDILTRLGLGERLNNMPYQLSGGQQQRVAIARALIHNPTVVLADEPTASLDSERAFQVVETFANLIHEHHRAGVIVTHDLRLCRYVERVFQMRDGVIARVIDDKKEIIALADRSQNEH
jgi:putative ABC transport system ATP-binding protein